MNITSILKLATAFVAFSISAHAAEVFRVATVSTTYPVTTAANFNAVDADGNFTNPYNIYGTTDIGSASGVVISTNFDGANSAINTGDQRIITNNNTGAVTTATTYFGPTFYAGVNRDVWQQSGTAIHSNGNGYRLRSNNVSADDIGTAQVGTAQVGTAQVGVEGDVDYAPASADYAPASADYAAATGNGGLPLQTRVIYMFDADTSILSGADDNLIFSESDTLTAKLAVAGQMGANRAIATNNQGAVTRSNNMASLATYRAVVKANGEYYAGSLYSVDLAALPNVGTDVQNMLENGYDATWTLMPNIEKSSHSMGQETNLIVDTSADASTIAGKYLTNITQVGFLLETETNANTGGYNFGVREFIANATPVSAGHPIEYSQDFPSTVTILDGLSGLTGDTHALTWSKSGNGLTATPASTVTQSNDQLVLALNGVRADSGAVKIHMVGTGTTNARRVRPPSHETTFVFDLINWKDGQADLNIQTYGHDGFVRSVISPSGNVKYTTNATNYTHTNFDNFSGGSKLRNNTNNPGIVIVDGGTVDPAAGGVVTVDISGNAAGTVVLNAAGDAVESVTITDFGSGYTAEPTLTWTGMSVDPTVSFNYETGSISRQSVKVANMRDLDQDWIFTPSPGTQDNSTLELGGNLLNDGQILTYIQSYANEDDSISYYYSLTDKATGVVTGPTFITTLTAADHSPGGNGFFDFTTGNKYPGTPNNQNAVAIEYKQWGNPGGQAASLAINSVTVALSDDDRDGINNRDDAFPTDRFETADSDSDGVGDNSDQHPGYNDSAVAAIDAANVAAGSDTFSYYVNGNWVNATNLDAWLTANSYIVDDGTSGGIEQSVYDAVVAERDAALVAQTTAQTELANAREARPGSTVIDVANDVATITLTIEQTDDVSDWTGATTSNHDIDLTAPTGASFYRFNYPEEQQS